MWVAFKGFTVAINYRELLYQPDTASVKFSEGASSFICVTNRIFTFIFSAVPSGWSVGRSVSPNSPNCSISTISTLAMADYQTG